jgi:N6-L-threonylcarbamoyladenine synthase
MRLLGSTIDDAAGEAFDKVSAILNLGYPGGPAVDAAARGADPGAVEFPRTLLGPDSLDFSFSGLKTAVLYHVNGVPGADKTRDPDKGIENLTEEEIRDIAASFQQAVVDVLLEKVSRAIGSTVAGTVILGGGVAANSVLRSAVTNLCEELGCTLRCAEMKYCTDNAAMIAGLAHHYLEAGKVSDLSLGATATVRR